MLVLRGDQWLEQAIKAEFQQRFSVEPKIDSTELFVTDPGFKITGVSIPLTKPPMNIEMESLLVQLKVNPTHIFSEQDVLDLEINLEKPELRWGSND